MRVALILILCLGIFGSTELEESRRRLSETRARLNRTRQEIRALERAERVGLERLELLSRQAQLSRSLLSQLEKAQSLKAEETERVKGEIAQTEQRLSAVKQDLASRLVTLYKYGRFLELELLLSSHSLPEVYRKYLYLRRVARADRRLFEECRALAARLRVKERELEAALKELSQLRAEAAAEAESLRRAQRSQEELLGEIRERRQAKERLERELEAAARRLEELIARLQAGRGPRRTPRGEHFLEQKKGRLNWPCPGRVVARYGTQVHPRYRTKTRNNGVDIGCTYGSPVRSVAPGKVVYADRFMGYGLMAILDHGDGYYTIYSNLSELTVKVGDVVAEGEELGRSSELLHFELRQGARPVDPLEWLK